MKAIYEEPAKAASEWRQLLLILTDLGLLSCLNVETLIDKTESFEEAMRGQ